MANIENQIDQISTAFYGSQVRGAIVESLESINDEVNQALSESNDVQSKSKELLNNLSSAESIYKNLSTETQSIINSLTNEKEKFIYNYGTLITDFNKCTSIGQYGYTPQTLHGPSWAGYGIIIVLIGNGGEYWNENTNWMWQILCDTSGIVGYRTGIDNSSFGKWIEIPKSSNCTFSDCTLTNDISIDGHLNISNKSGEIIFQNSQNQNMLTFNPYNDTFLFENLFTNMPLFSINPVEQGYDTVKCSCNIQINELGGNVFYTNSNNENIIESTVANDKYIFMNAITEKSIFDITPVKNGDDTINIEAGMVVKKDMQILPSAGIHFVPNRDIDNFQLAIGYSPNENIFGLWDKETWKQIAFMNANNTNLINFQSNVALNNGLSVNGSPVIQSFKTITGTINFSSTVSGEFSATFWTFNGSLLSEENQGNSNSNQLGILNTNLVIKGGSITLDPNDVIQLQFDEIPNFGAMPIDLATTGAGKVWDSPIFKTTLFNNTLSFIFPGPTLQEGSTYGAYALIIGNQY